LIQLTDQILDISSDEFRNYAVVAAIAVSFTTWTASRVWEFYRAYANRQQQKRSFVRATYRPAQDGSAISKNYSVQLSECIQTTGSNL